MLVPTHPNQLPQQAAFDVLSDGAQSYVAGIRQQQQIARGEHYGRGYLLYGDYQGYFFEPFLPAPILAGATRESRDDLEITGRLRLDFNGRAQFRDEFPSTEWDKLDIVPNAIGEAASDMAVTLVFSGLNGQLSRPQRIRRWLERKLAGQQPQTQAVVRRIGSIAAGEA